MGVQKFDADSQYTLERIATEVATKTVIRLQEQGFCDFHTVCKSFSALSLFSGKPFYSLFNAFEISIDIFGRSY
jgi:hypothetical protein